MKIEKNTRIAVLLGGLSKERDVSLRSGKAMADALRRAGFCEVLEIDVGHDLPHVLSTKKVDVAVIALHGKYGEDGSVQGVLEFLKIPYTGTGILGSALAMDKVASKRAFVACGVKTPLWLEVDGSWLLPELTKEIHQSLGFPCVAKPANEGSTLGITVVRSENDIEAAWKLAAQHDPKILWERYVVGREVTVGFLHNEPLPIVEIVPKKGVFDYEAKYTKGFTEYFCPARISESLTLITQEEARKAFRAVCAESFGRVDVILEENTPWVLEVNTIPGMTETSLVPKAVRSLGKSFEEMVEDILRDASLKLTQGA